MTPPAGDRGGAASGSSSKQRIFLEPPPPVNSSTVAPIPSGPGCNISRSASASPGLSASASATPTPASSPAPVSDGTIVVVGEGNGSAVGGDSSGQQGTSNANAIPVEGDEPKEDPQPSGKRKKKCTSDVWQYFDKKTLSIEDHGKTYVQTWGHCKFPKCTFKARGEGNYGTSGFWSHLRVSHSIVKGQQQLKVETEDEKDIVSVQPYRYDEEASLRKFYLAIVMHEYPFNISEHEFFVEFIKSLRPSFPMKSRVTVRKEIQNMYLQEKEKLYAYFKNISCRFSATMDMWTSNQNKSYMCVTVHWVDDNWCIQKRIVNFVNVEGRHTGTRLAETFTELMVKWYIDKRLFSLTLDNASANEVAVKDIITSLKSSGNGSSSLVCDGLFFHVRCACHILNLVARDGLSVIAQTIENIRQLVLAVKGSPLQWDELMKRAAECGLDTSKGLSLDVATRWNSTYLMLRDAIYYKPAFIRLKSSDNRRYEKITPSALEWAMAYKLFKCLKKFYDLTELFSGTLYPTANLFYKGFCEIKILLDDWSVSQDTTISAMAASMSKKFEKYWKKSHTTLAIACFLDPRYKKRLIEFYMKKFYGVTYQTRVDDIISVIKKLYQFYVTLTPSVSRAKGKSNEPSTSQIDVADADLLEEEEENEEELQSYLYQLSGNDEDDLNELDKYMADPNVRYNGQFDILAWWKNQIQEFPILSQIARDLLAVQVSTVASESAFSAGGRVIDPFRSRLDPEIVEALICMKDWVHASRRDMQVGSIVGDLEVIEAIASKLMTEDDQVANSEDEVEGRHARDLDYFD